ncbi:MAG: hypothetical protein EPN84_00360 [Legionella sp.]|nr:MAG: hypothetical protein EPN84_00360 [Legionella sp.]
MEIKELLRPPAYAIGGGALGFFSGSVVGAAYGAAVSATGTGILRAATNGDHNIVSASAEMGALGSLIFLGIVGTIAGSAWGLSKGNYLSLKPGVEGFYAVVTGLLVFATPLVGGAIGQPLLRDIHDNQLSSMSFFLFNLLGTFIDVVASIVVGGVFTAFFVTCDCQPEQSKRPQV